MRANPKNNASNPECDTGKWIHFDFDGVPVQLWVAEPPDTVQAVISETSSFYEVESLEFLRSLLPPKPRIVDVGANIGNHAVFFDKICRASKVWVIEPNSAVFTDLMRNSRANDCRSIDTTHLGIAAGASEGRANLYLSDNNARFRNRGGTRVKPKSNGAVPICRLDSLICGRIDCLKIDVEGMVVDVLVGAGGLIHRFHPLLLIEVMASERTRVESWIKTNEYEIVRVFPMYKDIDNYVCRTKWPRLRRRLIPLALLDTGRAILRALRAQMRRTSAAQTQIHPIAFLGVHQSCLAMSCAARVRSVKLS